jgi:cysteine desulfuration protein SufE
MPNHPPKLARLLNLAELLTDRTERIQWLIDTADRWRPIPDDVAQRPYPADHRTPACESEVYVFARLLPDGTLKFQFAVENPQGVSAMAMAVILDETCSREPVEQVATLETDIVLKIFGNELSMGKNMGLMGMVTMVQRSARAHAARSAGGR